MKHIVLIFIFVGLSVMAQKPKTEEDKAAYAIGILNGEGLLNQAKNPRNQDTLDYDVVKKGMEDFLKMSFEEKQAYFTGIQMAYSVFNLEQQNNLKDKFPSDMLVKGFADRVGKDSTRLAMDSDSTFLVLANYFESVNPQLAQNLRQQFEKTVLGKKNLVEGEKFLEDNKKKKGVKTTASGLQYEILKEGMGERPTTKDRVKVLYKGSTLDGKVFDETSDGQPREFGVNQVIPGWQEGLQLMKKGSKYKFYIPADLAYGAQGNQSIAPNAALVFEVELLGITEIEETSNPGMQLTPEQIEQIKKQMK